MATMPENIDIDVRLREIALDWSRLALQPSDVIVLQMPTVPSDDLVKQVNRYFRSAGIANKILVLDSSVKLAVIGAEGGVPPSP